MAPFYGWGSTASRLEPLRGGSLLFTTNEPATSTDNVAVREQNQQVALIELAPLCSHPDLKKDAVFVDDLAKFIKTHDTSSKFLPHVTALKNST